VILGALPRTEDVSWCSGLAGEVLARATCGTSEDLDGAVAALALPQALRDSSVCHGEMGLLEAFVTAQRAGSRSAAMVLPGCAGRALGAFEQYGPRCGTPRGVPSPGLLTGLAGIGYGLLRLGFPDQVPSLPLLGTVDPTEHDARQPSH
jgi:lantibiotic modifying enzyme